MKIISTILLSALVGSLASGAPPKVNRPNHYRVLQTNSMFTDPPKVEPASREKDTLPDWVLVGVSKYLDRVEVEIMNKKDRDRVLIPSDKAKEMGFSVVKVKQGRDFLAESVVTLKKGGFTGEVVFDKQFLVLKKMAGPAPKKPGSRKSPTGARATNTPNSPPVPGAKRGKTPPTPSNKRVRAIKK